jgi:hypothetical protein
MDKSKAEEMAEAAYKAYYSKIMCKGSLPSHAEISINFYLAGMKAMSELVKAWASECAEYADDARERQIGEKLKRFIDKTMGQDG